MTPIERLEEFRMTIYMYADGSDAPGEQLDPIISALEAERAALLEWCDRPNPYGFKHDGDATYSQAQAEVRQILEGGSHVD